MSDNDSVNRGNVRRELARFIDCNKALVNDWVAKHIDIVVSIVPPVSHEELSAKELLLIEERLFQDDDAFRDYIDLLWHKKIDEAIAYAQKWAKEHMVETQE